MYAERVVCERVGSSVTESGSVVCGSGEISMCTTRDDSQPGCKAGLARIVQEDSRTATKKKKKKKTVEDARRVPSPRERAGNGWIRGRGSKREAKKRQKRPERLCQKGTSSSRTVEANTVELARNCRREERKDETNGSSIAPMPVHCDATSQSSRTYWIAQTLCQGYTGTRST